MMNDNIQWRETVDVVVVGIRSIVGSKMKNDNCKYVINENSSNYEDWGVRVWLCECVHGRIVIDYGVGTLLYLISSFSVDLYLFGLTFWR